MQKVSLIIGAVSGTLAVMIGAFGAHAFKKLLEQNDRVATFETAVQYQFFHTLAIIFLALLMDKYSTKFLNIGVWAFLTGIILFSGSLYILSLTGNTKWGAVAPFGGAAFVVGWAMLFVAVLNKT